MSLGTDGWSVDVHAATAVLTFPPGDEMGRRSLAVDDAGVVWERVGLAQLLAGRHCARGVRPPSYWMLSGKPLVTGRLLKVAGHKVEHRRSIDFFKGEEETGGVGEGGEVAGVDGAIRGGAK